jgi:2-dehydro-3-deoxygalactonokinase
MPTATHFLSCDWGTTRFRLRLVERATLRVGATYESDRGIQVLDQQYRQQDQLDRLDFFAAYLREAISEFPTPHRHHPVVVSGMASANIGMQELPYAELPLAQSGAGLHWRHLSPAGGPALLLISGVRGGASMMRGEETQAIGLADELAPYGSGLLILPGTHSKHLTYQDGVFTVLRTYLTGELFELLSRRSILGPSVAAAAWSPARAAAFREGVLRGHNGVLSAELFTIRAGHLLRGTAPEDNWYRLSGTLIGHELAALSLAEAPVFLAAGEPLFSLYRPALETMLPAAQVVGFDGAALERALLTGQRKVLERYDPRDRSGLRTAPIS